MIDAKEHHITPGCPCEGCHAKEAYLSAVPTFEAMAELQVAIAKAGFSLVAVMMPSRSHEIDPDNLPSLTIQLVPYGRNSMVPACREAGKERLRAAIADMSDEHPMKQFMEAKLNEEDDDEHCPPGQTIN